MLGRFCAVVAILLAPVLAMAQPVADHIPADAMIYLGWRGSADPGPGYAGSNLQGFLADSGIPDLIDKFLPKVLSKVGQLQPEAGPIAKIVSTIARPSFQRPTAFFFSGVDLVGQPMPHLGIIWQAGPDGDALAKQLDQLLANANVPIPTKVVHTQDLVALMVGYDNAEAALKDAATKSLAADDTFKKTFSHLRVTDPTFAAYVDYERLWGLIDTVSKQAGVPELSDKWPKIRDDLGLAGMKHVAVASGFSGKDFGTEAFLEAPEPRHGLLALDSGKPLSDMLLSAIPSTATTAGAGHLDLGGLYDLIHKTVADVQPDAVGMIDDFLKDVEQGSGVQLRKDLLNSLGDEWAYFADPTIGGRGFASVTGVNHLKDPAKFEAAMSRIEEFGLEQLRKAVGQDVPVSIRFETAQINGMTIHYLAVPIVTPSWVVSDGNLYVALFPEVVAAAAGHAAAKGPSIKDNPAFADVQKRLGQQSPGGFQFMDLPKTAPDAYGAWLFVSHLAQAGDLFGIKAPPMIMPELPKLISHLSPAGSVQWVDAEGFHLRHIEPFPGSTLVASDPTITLLYTYPAAISVMLPALSKAREQASRVKSSSNLRQIGLAAMIYANENNGKFPPDFSTMIAKEDLMPQVFVNPSSANSAVPPADKAQWPAWVEEHSDYVWLGKGKTTAAGPDSILAYEKMDGAGEGINILFGDGHVEFKLMFEAEQLIEKAKAAKVDGKL
jgi:prepilin-type processing-associated H-X9-DG protein